MKKIGFLYFGRLEREKGFDAILEMIKIFGKENQELPFELYVFGDGTYKNSLVELTARYHSIHYFGRKDLETIKRYVPNCQYCLMPSTFLETFGMTALTSLSRNLPVIGFAKGGLKPFIAPELDLTLTYGQTTSQKLHSLIEKLINSELKITDSEIKISDYSIDSRKEKIKGLLPQNTNKIFLVTDFKNKIGGIETYVHDVKDILQSMGYEVQIFGGHLPAGVIGKIVKYLGILAGIFNFYEAIRLHFMIKKFKPDLIRYHSILRYLGWMPVLVSKFSKAKKRMMYHDFGYVHPFPHALTHAHQIHPPLTFTNYIKGANGILAKIFSAGKYLSVSLIHNQLKKHIDLHLVPSEFMTDIIHKSYQIPKEKIIELSHFIQG